MNENRKQISSQLSISKKTEKAVLKTLTSPPSYIILYICSECVHIYVPRYILKHIPEFIPNYISGLPFILKHVIKSSFHVNLTINSYFYFIIIFLDCLVLTVNLYIIFIILPFPIMLLFIVNSQIRLLIMSAYNRMLCFPLF